MFGTSRGLVRHFILAQTASAPGTDVFSCKHSFKATMGQNRTSDEVGDDLSDGDVVVVAEVQSLAGLPGLDEQLHPPLMLPPLQKEVSCTAK